jgi:hypothetical protein
MFWNEPLRDAALVPVRASSKALILVLAIALIVLGFWQQPLAEAISPVLRPAANTIGQAAIAP